ncbi:MAG: efflux RND transporter periplasmic adaptor subunit, partial [Myxococcales bacterium]|nr:efflux RND transporter periplasmic adaptor subunit [Myxococcales bacterium]
MHRLEERHFPRALASTRAITGIAAALGASALLLAAGCSGKPQGGAPPGAGGPPEVTVQTPTVKTITEWDSYTGRVAAVQSVEVRARVGGYVTKILFDDGAEVQRGDVLFKIDPRPFQAAFDAAKAQLAQAEAQYTLAKSLLPAAEKLAPSGGVSQETLETRRGNVATGRAAVAAAQAAVESARLNLDFTDVRAPVAGRVGRHLVDDGALVSGGSAGATLLTTVVSERPVYFYFNIDERAASRYAARWPATLR